MNLPKMIYDELEQNDVFGLKILKNGFGRIAVSCYPAEEVFTSISLREMESLLDQNHEQNEREVAQLAESSSGRP